MTTDPELPLAGVRVLALEHMYSLPFATLLMAYLGADVVKVEPPGSGELARSAVLGVADDDGNHVGFTYAQTNIGKRSVCIDIGQPKGADLIRRLAGNFDVVASNFRPGVMEKYGLGYKDLESLNPKIVYVFLSGFGSLVPTAYSARPGFAPIAEAMSGLYDYKNPPGHPPVVAPMGALGDLAPGVFSVVGILAALLKAGRTGRGSFVDVAMYDVMVAMANVVPGYWSMGVTENSPETSAGVLSAFKADDGWFVIMALRELHLQRLAEVIGRSEWLTDPRFSERVGWNRHLEDVVRPAIDGWARGRTRSEVCEELGRHGVAAGPCHSAEDVVHDAHLRQHEMLVEVERPDSARPLIAVGNPVKFAGVGQPQLGRWPRLGEHTASVLGDELGLNESELAALAKQGAIGLYRGREK